MDSLVEAAAISIGIGVVLVTVALYLLVGWLV